LTHGTGWPQVPLALHVCTPLPEHPSAPGEHDPEHAPLTHAEVVQGTAVPHVPLEVHDSTALPLHFVWPGAHTPVQAPLLHVWSTHATPEPQAPASLHVSRLLLVHWVELGEHVTHVPLRHAGVVPEHVVCVCQLPDALHVWMRLPRHCV
jgi:hypothetical protein